MLNNRLKNIQRMGLKESTQNEHLQRLEQLTEKQRTKQKRTYTTVLVVFAMLIAIFAQTLSMNHPELTEQSTTLFELDELTKTTYLYNSRANRQLNLSSPFYLNKLTITDQTVLNEFRMLFQGAEMKPYTGDLTKFSSSSDYLFELKNGQSVYLKSIYENNKVLIINPKTMMEIHLSESKWLEFYQRWLELQTEDTGYPTWKAIGLALVIILKLLLPLKNNNDETPLRKNAIFINVVCSVLWVFLLYSSNKWLGAGHFMLFLGISNFCLLLQEALYVFLKYDQPNWKRFWGLAIFLNIIVIIILI
ncbi:MAG: hypothetical protein RR642_03675 [Solibacillus sp.]